MALQTFTTHGSRMNHAVGILTPVPSFFLNGLTRDLKKNSMIILNCRILKEIVVKRLEIDD